MNADETFLYISKIIFVRVWIDVFSELFKFRES